MVALIGGMTFFFMGEEEEGIDEEYLRGHQKKNYYFFYFLVFKPIFLTMSLLKEKINKLGKFNKRIEKKVNITTSN